MTKLLNEMGSGELTNHIVRNYKNPENFPRSNPKRLKEKPLIYNMEKISIIGSYKNRFSGEETSLAMAIQIRCLDKHLKGLNMKEIYDVMLDIVKKMW